MHPYSQKLFSRLYGSKEHPYHTYLNIISHYLTPQQRLVVDAGCGRHFPDLKRLSKLFPSMRMIGLDMINWTARPVPGHLNLVAGDLGKIPLKEGIADIVISKSVLEHLDEPLHVYQEIYRVLKHGGYFIFLVPNDRDYVSVISKLIPARFHARIVKSVEGRNEADVFPTYYKSNNYLSIMRYAKQTSFKVERLEYYGQYPSYLAFNPFLFFVGSVYDRVICKYSSLRTLRAWILVVLRK